MVTLFSRTVRVDNELVEDVRLKIEISDPGPYPIKEIDIKPECHAYISYATIDTSHNPDRRKEVWIIVGDRKIRRIKPEEIRDNKFLKLKRRKGNNDEIILEAFKGNFIGRLGFVWMVKEFGRNLICVGQSIERR